MCVAISDTHIITCAAQFLTVWRGRGPRAKLLTTGGFRLDALDLLIPGKFDAVLSAFSLLELRGHRQSCGCDRLSSGGDCFLHVVAIILLSDPSWLAAPTKTTASCGLGAPGGGAEVEVGGGISAYCPSGELSKFLSANNFQNTKLRATSASTGLCRADHKQSLCSLEEAESINNLSRFG